MRGANVSNVEPKTVLQAAQSAVEKRIASVGGFKCSLCDSTEWFVVGLTDLPLVEQPEYNTEEPVLPMAVLACRNCRRLEFMSIQSWDLS